MSIGENAKRDWQERKEAERAEQDRHDAEKRKALEEQEAQKSDWQKDMEETQVVADALATTGQTQQEIEDALFGSSITDDEKSTQEDAMAPKLGVERLRVLKSLEEGQDQQDAPQQEAEGEVEDLDAKMRDVAQRGAQSGHEEASQWLSLDEKAQDAERHIKSAERELAKRQDPDYTIESYQKMTDAHLAYAQHVGEKRPHIFQTEEREAYDERKRELQTHLNESKAEHFQRIENIKPDELERLQNYIDMELSAHQDATQERSSIAHLPSEVAQENAQVDVKKYLDDLGQAWTPADGKQETKAYEQEVLNNRQSQTREHRQQM